MEILVFLLIFSALFLSPFVASLGVVYLTEKKKLQLQVEQEKTRQVQLEVQRLQTNIQYLEKDNAHE
jgi:hypothetical protein